MSLVLTPLKTTFWWKTLYELPSRIIIWRSVNVFHESFKQKRSRFDCKNYFVKLKIKQISSEYLLQVHTISINTSKFHVSFNALLAVNFTRNENEISEFLYFWMKIVSKEILHHFFFTVDVIPKHTHIMRPTCWRSRTNCGTQERLEARGTEFAHRPHSSTVSVALWIWKCNCEK